MALSNLGLIQMGGAMLRPGGSLGDGFLAYGNGLQGDAHMQTQQAKMRLLQESAANEQMDRQSKLATQHQQQEYMRQYMEALRRSEQGDDPAPVAPASPATPSDTPAPSVAPVSGTVAADPVTVLASRLPKRELTQSQRLLGHLGGVTLDSQQKLAESGNWGRAKVARTVEIAGPNNEPYVVQIDDFGQQVGQPMPKAVALKMESFGGTKKAWNEYTGQTQGPTFAMTQTPDSVASNRLGWANHNETSRHNRANEANPRGVPLVTATGETILVDPRSGNAIPVTMGGQEVKQGKVAEDAIGRVREAKDVLDLLNMAEPLVKNATGSIVGAGIDYGASAFGGSTAGADAIAQLKAIQGSLVSKMPKMTGPQSDKDVLLYREMAGQIGDPRIPRSQKQAAMNVIRALNEKYAGMAPGSSKPSGGASGGWSARELP